MIKRLIVNADDFGMSQGNTIGIILGHKQGIITSTTCMMNMPYAKFALDLAKDCPDLGVGIHFVLTAGKPLLEGGTSFTDENGCFKNKKTYPDKQPHPDEEELYKEWKAQMELFIEVAGKKPTHIDSHHHVHMLPWMLEVTERLAREYDLPIRQRGQVIDTYEYVKVHDKMYDDDINYDYMTNVLTSEEGTLEYMCHPALMDQRLYEMSSYNLPRMKELQLLTSQEMKDFIKEHNIELIHYGHLKKIL